MDIQIERAAETLYQGCCPGLGRLTGKTRFLDQMCGKTAVDNTERPHHDAGLEFQAVHFLAYGKETSGENGNLRIKLFAQWEA